MKRNDAKKGSKALLSESAITDSCTDVATLARRIAAISVGPCRAPVSDRPAENGDWRTQNQHKLAVNGLETPVACILLLHG